MTGGAGHVIDDYRVARSVATCENAPKRRARRPQLSGVTASPATRPADTRPMSRRHEVARVGFGMWSPLLDAYPDDRSLRLAFARVTGAIPLRFSDVPADVVARVRNAAEASR